MKQHKEKYKKSARTHTRNKYNKSTPEKYKKHTGRYQKQIPENKCQKNTEHEYQKAYQKKNNNAKTNKRKMQYAARTTSNI